MGETMKIKVRKNKRKRSRKEKILIAALAVTVAFGAFAGVAAFTGGSGHSGDSPVSRIENAIAGNNSSSDKEKSKGADDRSAKKDSGSTASSSGESSSGTSSGSSSSSSGSSALYCTVSITCGNLVGNSSVSSSVRSRVPSNGVIMGSTRVRFSSGESALTVSRRAAGSSGVSISAEGNGYVNGIAGIYEKDAGSKSGWMYKVNGSVPSSASSGYTVSSGDSISWVYTCDLGNDI